MIKVKLTGNSALIEQAKIKTDRQVEQISKVAGAGCLVCPTKNCATCAGDAAKLAANQGNQRLRPKGLEILTDSQLDREQDKPVLRLETLRLIQQIDRLLPGKGSCSIGAPILDSSTPAVIAVSDQNRPLIANVPRELQPQIADPDLSSIRANQQTQQLQALNRELCSNQEDLQRASRYYLTSELCNKLTVDDLAPIKALLKEYPIVAGTGAEPKVADSAKAPFSKVNTATQTSFAQNSGHATEEQKSISSTIPTKNIITGADLKVRTDKNGLIAKIAGGAASRSDQIAPLKEKNTNLNRHVAPIKDRIPVNVSSQNRPERAKDSIRQLSLRSNLLINESRNVRPITKNLARSNKRGEIALHKQEKNRPGALGRQGYRLSLSVRASSLQLRSRLAQKIQHARLLKPLLQARMEPNKVRAKHLLLSSKDLRKMGVNPTQRPTTSAIKSEGKSISQYKVNSLKKDGMAPSKHLVRTLYREKRTVVVKLVVSRLTRKEATAALKVIRLRINALKRQILRSALDRKKEILLKIRRLEEIRHLVALKFSTTKADKRKKPGLRSPDLVKARVSQLDLRRALLAIDGLRAQLLLEESLGFFDTYYDHLELIERAKRLQAAQDKIPDKN